MIGRGLSVPGPGHCATRGIYRHPYSSLAWCVQQSAAFDTSTCFGQRVVKESKGLGGPRSPQVAASWSENSSA